MSKKDKKQETVEEDVLIDNNEEQAIEETQTEFDAVKVELQKEKERFLRLFAEFENYKKRTGRERVELFKTASEGVMVSLLPVLDDFERALMEIKKSDDDNLYQGVAFINNKFVETLKNKGLQQIETKQGDTFNADHHEAITQIPAPSKKLKGKIIDVIEKGYSLGEKIIRYPKVVIGQ